MLVPDEKKLSGCENLAWSHIFAWELSIVDFWLENCHWSHKNLMHLNICHGAHKKEWWSICPGQYRTECGFKCWWSSRWHIGAVAMKYTENNRAEHLSQITQKQCENICQGFQSNYKYVVQKGESQTVLFIVQETSPLTAQGLNVMLQLVRISTARWMNALVNYGVLHYC